MRLHRWVSRRVGYGIALALGLAASSALLAFVHEDKAKIASGNVTRLLKL